MMRQESPWSVCAWRTGWFQVVVDVEDDALCGDLVHRGDLVVWGPDGCPRHQNP